MISWLCLPLPPAPSPMHWRGGADTFHERVVSQARLVTCGRLTESPLQISNINESCRGQPVADPLQPNVANSNMAAPQHLKRESKHTLAPGVMLVFLLFFVTAFAKAQDDTATDNDVIRVAERMYCPVCENIPLDECQTGACLEWKEEIRAQLTAGRSEQEVIDSFVARFGDHVVGVPQDPVLRALTMIMPLLATALAIGVGLHTFRIFGVRQRLGPPQEVVASGETTDDVYRQRLEEDLRARR